MLKSIVLENFKKHSLLEVDFTNGMNVIRGPNFAGKSTVLAAVAFARYGVKAVAGDKKELIKTGEKNCKVTLVETLDDGSEVTFLRTATTAKVLIDNKVVATGNAPVSAWVQDNIGVDLTEYLTHTYSQQMETSAILTSGAAKLQRDVEKLANVDLIDKVVKLCGTRTTFLNGKMEGVDTSLDAEACKKYLEKFKEKSARKNDDIALVRDKLNKLQRDAIDLVKQKSEADTYNANIDRYIETVDGYKSQIKGLAAEIEDHKSNLLKFDPDVKAKIEALSDKVKALEDKIFNGQKQALSLSKQNDYVKELNTWIDEEGRPNVEIANELGPKLDDKIEELDKVSAAHKKAEESLAELCENIRHRKQEIESGSCRTCGRAYEDDEENIEVKKYDLSEAEARKDVLKGDVFKKDKIRVRVLSELVELKEEYPGDDTQEQLDAALVNLGRAVKKIKELETSGVISMEDMSSAGVDLELMRTDLTNLSETDDFQEHHTDQITWKRKKIENIEETLEGTLPLAKAEKKDVHVIFSSIERTAEEVQEVRNIFEVKNLEATEALANVVAAESDLERATKAEKLTISIGADLKKLEKLSKYLRTSRQRFMGSVWESILGRATEIASTTTEGTEDQITAIGKKDSGGFTYTEKGVEFSVKSASGCQKEIMGVSLRLALCDLFYGQGSYMMLDESSSQMNEENASAMAGTLAATGKQIIYVTHRDSEQLIADNVIFVGGEQ